MTGATQVSTEKFIDRIIEKNERIRKSWSNPHGWAPDAAAQLLSKSRLDWQVALSHCLRLWIKPFPEHKESGYLILGYANLGSLVEGTMMLFLSVHYKDYCSDGSDDDTLKDDDGKLRNPDSLTFDPLREFIKKINILESSWDVWLRRVQQRRNAIHAFKSRDIGTHKELLEDMPRYLDFIERIDSHLPYLESEEPDY
ncbi:MAG: hypothetical protein L0H94_09645 [Nitrospira sp.]|nr:hypothetical protein [Nitrospira sp.]